MRKREKKYGVNKCVHSFKCIYFLWKKWRIIKTSLLYSRRFFLFFFWNTSFKKNVYGHFLRPTQLYTFLRRTHDIWPMLWLIFFFFIPPYLNIFFTYVYKNSFFFSLLHSSTRLIYWVNFILSGNNLLSIYWDASLYFFFYMMRRYINMFTLFN